jgi:hypothetical protein
MSEAGFVLETATNRTDDESRPLFATASTIRDLTIKALQIMLEVGSADDEDAENSAILKKEERKEDDNRARRTGKSIHKQ